MQPNGMFSRGGTHAYLGANGGTEMQLNSVAERHLGPPRETSSDRSLPFNQLRTNAATPE